MTVFFELLQEEEDQICSGNLFHSCGIASSKDWAEIADLRECSFSLLVPRDLKVRTGSYMGAKAQTDMQEHCHLNTCGHT